MRIGPWSMRIGLFALVAGLHPEAPAVAQSGGSAQRSWEALATDNAAPAAVLWNHETGAADSIFGRFGEAGGRVSEQAARAFLAENADLFKLSEDTADLFLVRETASPIGRHLVFEQRLGGVPVDGAQVKVHYNKEARVIAVNNAYRPGIRLASTQPRVTLERALQAIVAAGPPASALDSERTSRAERLRRALPEAKGALVVYVRAGSAHLAWKVQIPTSRETWEAIVDARGGRLLAPLRDINRYVTGTGRVFTVNAVVATQDNTLTDQADSAAAVPESAYTIVPLEGLDGSGFLDGQYAASSRTKKRAFDAGNAFLFDRSSDGFSETLGYHSFDYAQRYIQSLGFTNVNNRRQVFAVNRLKIDNSFYSPSSKQISLGTGGVDDAEDAEVIWHEYGHSIQDDQVPGFGSSLEAGSMGEGFGDYWAGSVGAQLSGGFQDECIAEWDATSYSSTTPPCLRRLDGTKHYPEDVAGEVHDDGEIWSAALWQIRGAVGATKADTLILQHHFLLSTTASFNQGANALVTAAINLGYTNRQVNLVRTILKDRGFTVTT